MREQIQKVYEIFRTMVMQDAGIRADHPGFFTTVSGVLPSSRVSDDPDLVRLAIIAYHPEWEILYQNIHPELDECLGNESRRLREEGLSYFHISEHELRLLREEVLYGKQTYPTLIEQLKYCEQQFRKDGAYGSLLELLWCYKGLRRIGEMHACLERILEYAGERGEAEMDYATCYCVILDDLVPEESPEIYSVVNIERVLRLMEDYYQFNRYFNRFSHSSYLQYWLKIIELYTRLIQEENVEGGNDSGSEPFSQRLSKVIGRVLEKPCINADRDLLKNAPTHVLELMKRHDELIFDLIEVSHKPDESFGLFEPYFRGNEILLWYKILNMSFPGKLEFVLDSMISGRPERRHDKSIGTFYLPLDMTAKELQERLLAEFPEHRKLIDKRFGTRTVSGEIFEPDDADRLQDDD